MDEKIKEYLDGLVNWEQLNILIAEKKKIIREIANIRQKLLLIVDEKERIDTEKELAEKREVLLYIESIRKKLIDILHS